MKYKFIVVLVAFFLGVEGYAAILKGVITDSNKEPIPYASVFVAKTTIGTSTNENGQFQLTLKPGNYTISVKNIGYTAISKEITISENETELNFELPQETIALKVFAISADAEDPAYAVIRNAIKKRKFYNSQVEAYSCDVYIKGVQRLQKKPNKVMGLKVNMNASWDTTSGIIYMSESVSKYYFQQPNKIKEQMVSSLVSGNNQAFSYNQASDMLFNFYDNVLDVIGLGARGFISPIANNALLTYRYKLLGTFYEQGVLVNKIQVIPKRKNDPAFAGIIYIMEDTWRIHSTDLYLTKDAQIDFVDTLHINQVFLPVTPDVWMPFSNNYSFSFDIFGFKGGGNYVGVNSNYVLNPNFGKDFFTSSILEVTQNANKKDTAYWNKYRPMPLTAIEQRDYVWRDSIAEIKSSKTYKDSVDKISNKFKLINLLSGYSYKNTFKRHYLRVNSPASTVLFNTVQGLTLGTSTAYTIEDSLRKQSTYLASVGYGFASKTVYGSAGFKRDYNPLRMATIEIEAGRKMEQYKPIAIPELLNTIYTLFDERNYLKAYQSDFLKLTHRSQISNAFFITNELNFANRSPLLNRSNYHWVDYDNRDYTSNNPQVLSIDSFAFNTNQIVKLNTGVVFRFKQKYLSYPNYKIMLDNKYPVLRLNYLIAFTKEGNKTNFFDRASVSLSQDVSLKLFGEFNYTIAAGKSLLKRPSYFIDYTHFSGNKTLFSKFESQDFMLLDYYLFSTSDYFVQAHLTYNLEGFLLNKIPVLKLLHLQEIVSVHYLQNDKINNYTELGFGIQRLFARIEFVTAFSAQTKVNSGIRFGLGF